MEHDEYWKSLVERVYQQHEILAGVEDLYFRFSCIYGETMVDGIQSYFERRVEEYEKDLAALREHGFGDIADGYEIAKSTMFGKGELTPGCAAHYFDRLYQDEELEALVDQQLSPIYERLIEQLEVLNEYKYQLGIRFKLFSE